LVFDGTHPYEALLGAMKDVPLTVWCRRPLWRAGTSAAPLSRTHLFDAVLEPGELAASEDRGPTAPRRAEAHRVAPIVFLDESELLPRAEAERELGLEPGMTTVLVQLGQGAEVREASRLCLRRLGGREGVQVAALSSAIAGIGDVPEGVAHLRSTYPISRYYRAFDATVSAAGYNAFHELIGLGPPSLLVPMPRRTDDQAARARWSSAAGAGLAVAGPGDGELERRLDELLDEGRRREMEERLQELRPINGAPDAARWLADVSADAGRPGDGIATGGSGGGASRLRPRLRRAQIFVSSLPRTVARLAWQTATLPRVRTLVIALGLEGGELERRVAGAIEAAPDPPERVLVVTDSLNLISLRATGAGVEHVPAAGSRQASLAGVDYRAFLRRRLDLILAERPRPRRTVALGEVPEELHG
jgi:hypothetical protein